MRILGVDLPRPAPAGPAGSATLVLLDEDGRIGRVQLTASLPQLTAAIGPLAAGEPFLLAIDVPVVVPAKAARRRPVEGLVRRRLGFRLPPGGRASLAAEPNGVAAETLMVGLAAAGLPCLPYPDRDRHRPGLAEVHPGLVLKSLLWQGSPLSADHDAAVREKLFRGYAGPLYRAVDLPGRTGWPEQASRIDLALRALGTVEGFDLRPARQALDAARSGEEVEAAAALLDASLIAGAARRYLDAPEASLFVGDPEGGYLILPADGFVRRLALSDTRTPPTRLFPQGSLRERLGAHAALRAVDLLEVPGKPQRLEATFGEPPVYEFDNVDEMLWWKHCRHLGGPPLPTEGLRELVVVLGARAPEGEAASLRLVRSRHRTLSFRFEPPSVWRARVPTRDGRTYAFRALRALYETLPGTS